MHLAICEKLGEHNPIAPHIRGYTEPIVWACVRNNLGSSVTDCALAVMHLDMRGRETRVPWHREPKIRERNVAGAREEYVGGLDVTVQNALCVQCFEREKLRVL